MTNENSQKDEKLKNEVVVEKDLKNKVSPELVWKGRKLDSDYSHKCTKYGSIVDELYNYIEFDKKYFNIVFDFFSRMAEPYTSTESELRKKYLALLKINHKRFGFNDEECKQRLTLFNKILDLSVDDFITLRGFFLEEFLKKKLQSQSGTFDRIFNEEEIEIKNHTEKSSFSTNSDIDIIHVNCSVPFNEEVPNKIGQLKKFSAYECKATVKSFMLRDVYTKRPKKKHINKVIYMAELTNLVSEIYIKSEKQLNIVGYKSLNEASIKQVKNAINRIHFRDYYDTAFLKALYDVRQFYKDGFFCFAGKKELEALLYA